MCRSIFVDKRAYFFFDKLHYFFSKQTGFFLVPRDSHGLSISKRSRSINMNRKDSQWKSGLGNNKDNNNNNNISRSEQLVKSNICAVHGHSMLYIS